MYAPEPSFCQDGRQLMNQQIESSVKAPITAPPFAAWTWALATLVTAMTQQPLGLIGYLMGGLAWFLTLTWGWEKFILRRRSQAT